MRRWFIALALALQFGVLAQMAARREWVRATGEIVWLRTAPVDPMDPFRGQYVRLDYEASLVPRDLLPADLDLASSPGGTPVWARLALDEEGVGQLQGLSARMPQEGIFLRGRVQQTGSAALRVRYGIEKYFVEQGTGPRLEAGRAGLGSGAGVSDLVEEGGAVRVRPAVRVPLEMEVALGSDGTAVLRGHRWCRLGIGIAIERAEGPAGSRPRRRARPVVGVRVRLANASSEPVAVVSLRENGSFRLVTAISQWSDSDGWRLAREETRAGAPRPEDVRILAPKGAGFETRIDLTLPRWRLRDPSGADRPLSEAPGGLRLRIVYSPPSREACRGLPSEAAIWHGTLPSQAFTPAGWVD